MHAEILEVYEIVHPKRRGQDRVELIGDLGQPSVPLVDLGRPCCFVNGFGLSRGFLLARSGCTSRRRGGSLGFALGSFELTHRGGVSSRLSA